MKPYIANLLNSIVLIVMGLWAYFSSESPSVTALIPVIFGGILLLSHPWMKKENKVAAHIVVGLTLLILVALIAKPLMSALDSGNNLAIFRIGLMILTSIIALITFVRSFINARKSKV